MLNDTKRRKYISKKSTNKLVLDKITQLLFFGRGTSAAAKLVELTAYYANKIELKGL